jgi:hypothetical protein
VAFPLIHRNDAVRFALVSLALLVPFFGLVMLLP